MSEPIPEASRTSIYTTEELSSVMRKKTPVGSIALFDPDPSRLLFVAERVIAILDPTYAKMTDRSRDRAILRGEDPVDRELRPGHVFAVGRNQLRRPDTDELAPCIVIENRNARGVKKIDDQVDEAIAKALDPDQFPQQ